MRISATVWDGEDYLPEVWDAWIAESQRSGLLIVGESDGRVVAIQHTRFQPGGIAWMEGIRVHVDYRNRGVGTRMLEHALEESANRGLSRARLSTAEVNGASARVALSHGFAEIGRFRIFRTAGSSEPPRGVKPAPTITQEFLSQACGSPGSPVLIVHQWTAYQLPGQIGLDEFPYRLAHEDGGRIDGVALGLETRDGTGLSIALLQGTSGAIRELGRAFARRVMEDAKVYAVAMVPERGEIAEGLTQAGYKRDEDLTVLVFERNLG